MNRLFCLLLLIFSLVNQVFAAGASTDYLQQTGKIYVVVIVIAVIFVGLSWYLYRLDRKIQQLEKRQEHE
ncbi:MAG: CcmD family protein [Saprospiraceae bacterium]|nr:CcmD family protein [Saprospiraceae bacterium]